MSAWQSTLFGQYAIGDISLKVGGRFLFVCLFWFLLKKVSWEGFLSLEKKMKILQSLYDSIRTPETDFESDSIESTTSKPLLHLTVDVLFAWDRQLNDGSQRRLERGQKQRELIVHRSSHRTWSHHTYTDKTIRLYAALSATITISLNFDSTQFSPVCQIASYYRSQTKKSIVLHS